MSAVIDRRAASARLWTRDFAFYFGARSVSMLGDAMTPVAAALAVGAIYGVSGVGYALSAFTSAFVIFVLVGGVFADRIGARTMMVGADLVRVGTHGAVGIVFFVGTPSLWLLLVASFLAGTAAAMFQPGVNGIVPLVARDPQRANATLKVADAATQLGGPVLAGLLMAFTEAGAVFVVDAGTFLISAGGLIAIRFRPERPLAAGGLAIAGFAFAPLSVALGLPLPLLMVGHLLAGCAIAFWSVMWSTSVQTQVGLDVLNRVTAYEVAGSIIGVAIGQALVGPVSSVVNPRTLLFVSSSACVTVCAALLLTGPIRRLR